MKKNDIAVHNILSSKGVFFKILADTPLSQVGVMTLAPGADSGPEEIHTGDQIIYIIEGEASVEVNKEKMTMKVGDITIISKGAQHHIYNAGSSDLFFLTMYAPPQY